MKKVDKRKLLDNLKVVHIQRYKNRFVDPSFRMREIWDEPSDMIETQLKYKGAVVITVYAELRPSTYGNGLRIDVFTNRKFIKKHDLPYRKTKVASSDKDMVFDFEVQLDMGVSYVRRLMYEIIREVEDKFDYEVDFIKTQRCNGIFMNSGQGGDKYRSCSVVIDKRKKLKKEEC